MVIPRTFGESFIVYQNPDKILFKRFYKLVCIERTFMPFISIVLNSTYIVLFWECIGIPAGLGALNVYKDDFRRIIIPKISEELISKFTKNHSCFFERKINDIYTECGFDKTQPIRSQEPNPLPDRKALDDIVFDAIGLTQSERKEVYWAVCELVQRRLQKAKSV
ncbi:MAG: hypothetical protein H8E60_10305 [Candidatus Marinimicrobia bacterium]|nr:hypothetical protein [Candidatus Neomarinimicrobiota bacterium]